MGAGFSRKPGEAVVEARGPCYARCDSRELNASEAMPTVYGANRVSERTKAA